MYVAVLHGRDKLLTCYGLRFGKNTVRYQVSSRNYLDKEDNLAEWVPNGSELF